MTDDQFDAFIGTCADELTAKQDKLEREHGLGLHDRWAYDVSTGILSFTDKAGVTALRARTTQIGSFAPEAGTFLWAWANESVPQEPRDKSERLQGLADITGIDVFRSEGLEIDEEMAWQIAAMSVHHLNAIGCYRGPANELDVFLAIDEILPLDAN